MKGYEAQSYLLPPKTPERPDDLKPSKRKKYRWSTVINTADTVQTTLFPLQLIRTQTGGLQPGPSWDGAMTRPGVLSLGSLASSQTAYCVAVLD